MSRLPPSAKTHVNEEGLIFGDDFQDSYFSRDDGLAESRFVFLQGCGLPDAWAGRSCFVIGELGFGTGLNVLAAWDLWIKHRPPQGILHIITVEGFLLDAATAQAAHQNWPELRHLSDQLIAHWPTRAYGPQRIWFPADGVCLTVLIGPCEEALSAMTFEADCWFLDGFSPSRNPDMWSPGVIVEIARLSTPQARVASYSVAGAVRVNLAAVGFDVSRESGFGAKRQRLEARFIASPSVPPSRPRSAIVIGGGIAGACVSAALRRRGLTIDLFDKDPCGRTKASGNPIALIMPRLDRADTREARFFRAAYLMALDNYRQLGSDSFSQTSVDEFAINEIAQTRLNDLGIDPPLPPDHLILAKSGHLTHFQGGVASPDAILKHLKTGANCHPVSVDRLEYFEDQWHVLTAEGVVIASADVCVIASGPAAEQFCDLGGALRGRAGLLSWAPIDGDIPCVPVTGSAYAAPFHTQLMFGATFERCDLDAPPPFVSAAGHAENRAKLALIAPDLAERIDVNRASGRTSVRATTPDQLPIAGIVSGPALGQYVVCGLGSRGFTTAFLCAEIVACAALGEPSPVEDQVAAALAPDRFLKRAKKRGGRLGRSKI